MKRRHSIACLQRDCARTSQSLSKGEEPPFVHCCYSLFLYQPPRVSWYNTLIPRLSCILGNYASQEWSLSLKVFGCHYTIPLSSDSLLHLPIYRNTPKAHLSKNVKESRFLILEDPKPECVIHLLQPEALFWKRGDEISIVRHAVQLQSPRINLPFFEVHSLLHV